MGVAGSPHRADRRWRRPVQRRTPAIFSLRQAPTARAVTSAAECLLAHGFICAAMVSASAACVSEWIQRWSGAFALIMRPAFCRRGFTTSAGTIRGTLRGTDARLVHQHHPDSGLGFC